MIIFDRVFPMNSSQSSPRVSCDSSRVSTSALVCTPRRHLQLRRAPLARSPGASSLNERLVRESFPRSPIYETIEPRQGVVLDVALVQPERKFINVAVKMLRAGVMIDANKTTLQDGKNAFDAVGCRLAANVFASAVIDCVVDKASTADTGIRAPLVGMQGRASLDMPVNGGLDRLSIRRLDRQSFEPHASRSR
jgi:hypothetical protein